MVRRATSFVALGVALACAGPARPVLRPAARPPALPTAQPVEAPPDLSPVPEPKSLVLVARVELDALSRLPLDAATRALVRSPLEALAPQLPSSLGELVTNAPLEVAGALDSPEVLLVRGADWVWSLPMVSFETALAQLRERERQDEVVLERRGPGVVLVTPRSDTPALACLLSVAVGSAPARPICAARRGGFFSLAGLGGLVRFVTMREHWEWTRRSVASLPHRGATRAPFSVAVQTSARPSGQSVTTRVVAKLELPSALLADVGGR